MKVLVASQNAKKVAEIAVILAPFRIEVTSLLELSNPLQVEETGLTFEANALLKARSVASATGFLTIADDSGIEVDALRGAPGVYSARFAGENASDADRNLLLLKKIEGVEWRYRTARFRCVAAIASPDGAAVYFAGSVDGYIAHEQIGAGGFGYDPIFFFPPFGMTFGQVPLAKKNLVSHRGKAFRSLADFIAVAGMPLSAPNSGRCL